jgi:hypothetical protein
LFAQPRCRADFDATLSKTSRGQNRIPRNLLHRHRCDRYSTVATIQSDSREALSISGMRLRAKSNFKVNLTRGTRGMRPNHCVGIRLYLLHVQGPCESGRTRAPPCLYICIVTNETKQAPSSRAPRRGCRPMYLGLKGEAQLRHLRHLLRAYLSEQPDYPRSFEMRR